MSIKKELKKAYLKLTGQYNKEVLKYHPLAEVVLANIITNQEIIENEAFIKKMLSTELNSSPQSCLCFLPYCHNIKAGGIKTILLILEALSKQFNCKSYLCFYPVLAEHDKNALKDCFAKNITKDFSDLIYEFIDYSDKLPSVDIAMCNLWLTAYPLLKFNNCQKKYYLVQDNESLFFPSGDISSLVNETYKFGFYGLTNSLALQRMYAGFTSSPSFRYLPGVNHKLYYPVENKSFYKDKYKVVFYGRPSISRNCFELLCETFKIVKSQLGNKIEIISVGENYDTNYYGLTGIINNIGQLNSLEKLATLYRECDIGVSLITTPTFSYQHLEFMASGLCLVTNNQDGINDFLEDNVNAVVSSPIPKILASRIIDLIDNPKKLSEISKNAINYSQQLDWDNCLKSICDFIYKG